MTTSILIALLIIGLAAGILSGLVGVGGGIVMVPLLVALLGYTQHQAQGTSLAVLTIPVTAMAVYNYSQQTPEAINWKYVGIIAVFFVIGGFFGSKIALQIDQKLLKKIFGILLLYVAGKMLLSK